MNGAGATATGIVTLLVIQAKFVDGAWMVVIAIPALISLFLVINRHYRTVSRRLRSAGHGGGAKGARAHKHNDPLCRASRRGDGRAAWYARQIAGSEYHPVYVPDDRQARPSHSLVGVQRRRHAHRDPRAARRSRRRSRRLRLGAAARRLDGSFEIFERPSLSTAIARRRSTFALKLRLLSEPGVVVTDVPVVLDAEHARPQPERAIARVLVSGVQAASSHARSSTRRHSDWATPERSSSPSTPTKQRGSEPTGSARRSTYRSTSPRRPIETWVTRSSATFASSPRNRTWWFPSSCPS